MALNTINTDAISFKKLSGKAHTQQNFAVTEEGISSNIQVSYTTVYAELIDPLPITNGGLSSVGSTDGVVKHLKFDVEIIPDTQIAAGRSQGYRLKLQNAETVSGVLYPAGTRLHTALGKLQLVPSLYGTLKPDGSTEYDPKLYQTNGTTQITKFDPINWYLDFYNGVLFVQDPPAGYDSSAARPGVVETFLYVGDYISDILAPSTGETGTTASNVGGGVGVFKEKTLNDLRFKSFLGINGIAVTGTTDNVILSFTGTSGGGTITGGTNGLSTYGSNIGLGGILNSDTTISGNSKTLNIGSPFSNLNNTVIYNSGATYVFAFNDGLDRLKVGGKQAILETVNNSLTTQASIAMDSNGITTTYIVASGATNTWISQYHDSYFITSSYPQFRGAEYDTDYSTNFGPRSIPDVAWVTGYTSSASTNVFAANGLHKVGDTILLGGGLTGDTTISGSSSLILSRPMASLFTEDYALKSRGRVLIGQDTGSGTGGALQINTNGIGTLHPLQIAAGNAIKFEVTTGGTTTIATDIIIGHQLASLAGAGTQHGEYNSFTEYAYIYQKPLRLLPHGTNYANNPVLVGNVTAKSNKYKLQVGGGLYVNTGTTSLHFDDTKFSVTGSTGGWNFTWDKTNKRFVAGDFCVSSGGSINYTFGDTNVNNGVFGSVMFGELSTIDAGVGSALAVGESVWIRAYGGKAIGRGTRVNAGGGFGLAGGSWIPGGTDPKTNNKVPQVGGFGAFGFYNTDGGQTDNHGALGAYSAILGGKNHNIPSNSTSSAVIGGDTIKVSSGVTNTVHMPKVRIGLGSGGGLTTNNANPNLLVINSVTGEIEIRQAITITGGTGASAQNVYSLKRIVTGSTTLNGNDFVIQCNGAAPMTLLAPASPVDGQVYKIKDVSGTAGTNIITISGNGKNIDGSSTILINTNRGGVEIVYDSTLDFWSVMNFVG